MHTTIDIFSTVPDKRSTLHYIRVINGRSKSHRKYRCPRKLVDVGRAAAKKLQQYKRHVMQTVTTTPPPHHHHQ
jgi:hypothetical protein